MERRLGRQALFCARILAPGSCVGLIGHVEAQALEAGQHPRSSSGFWPQGHAVLSTSDPGLDWTP
jgi:hypothetical protein